MKSVLTEADKREIIGMYFGEDSASIQYSQSAIAEKFNVSQSTICNAIKHSAYEYCAKIKAMRSQDIPEDEIERRLGITHHLSTSLWAHALNCMYR